MALLKQPQYSPYPLPQMTVSLWLGTTGPARQGARPTTCCASSRSSSTSCVASTRTSWTRSASSRSFDDATEEKVDGGVRRVPRPVRDQRRRSIKPGTEAKADPVTDEELEQEQIVKQKRD